MLLINLSIDLPHISLYYIVTNLQYNRIVSHGTRFVKNNHIILKLGDCIIVISLDLNIRESWVNRKWMYLTRNLLYLRLEDVIIIININRIQRFGVVVFSFSLTLHLNYFTLNFVMFFPIK